MPGLRPGPPRGWQRLSAPEAQQLSASAASGRSPSRKARHLLQSWQRHPDLLLVLAALVPVGNLRLLFAPEEEHLRDPLVGIDLRRQGRGVRYLERHIAFPFRLKRRDVGDDATARVRRLADRDGQDVSRDTEVFD